MRKKIKYADESLGKLEIIEDFLPAPHGLVFKEEDVCLLQHMRWTRSSVENPQKRNLTAEIAKSAEKMI